MSSASSIAFAPVAPACSGAAPCRREARGSLALGLLGFGQVGQAVARLAADGRVNAGGWRFRVTDVLVRDPRRPRDVQVPASITNDPAAFLRGRFDVVIEALGGVEPARTLVAQLLGRGVPVVTANKALFAAHGRGLAALARKNGTSVRCEATALAGVPFLGALAARPLVSDLDRCAAVVNGTSNFILSKMASEGWSFDAALQAARALGLTEPDDSRDLDGLDAADKLTLLASMFGWGRLPASTIDVAGIRGVTPLDLSAARSLGATIKPVACAARSRGSVTAFVGPALVPSHHPLASLQGTLTGIQLSGRFVSDLFFSGPGAGPDVTAATLLDDAIEAVASVPAGARRAVRSAEPLSPAPAVTGWFIRASFPGLVPEASTLRAACAGFGLDVQRVTEAADDSRWLLVGAAPRERIAEAEARLRERHRIRCLSLRTLGDWRSLDA